MMTDGPIDQDASASAAALREPPGLAAHEGRFGGPPLPWRRVVVRSVLWFVAGALAALVVTVLVQHPFDPTSLLLCVAAGGIAALVSCAIGVHGSPSGYVPTVLPEERVRDRRIRRALRRDDPAPLSDEEYAEAVRRAPYIAARGIVQTAMSGWYAIAIAVPQLGLRPTPGGLQVIVAIAILAVVVSIPIVVVQHARTLAFARRSVDAPPDPR